MKNRILIITASLCIVGLLFFACACNDDSNNYEPKQIIWKEFPVQQCEHSTEYIEDLPLIDIIAFRDDGTALADYLSDNENIIKDSFFYIWFRKDYAGNDTSAYYCSVKTENGGALKIPIAYKICNLPEHLKNIIYLNGYVPVKFSGKIYECSWGGWLYPTIPPNPLFYDLELTYISWGGYETR